ncbi:MAG TPA: sulfatase-like hydrolase/transferase [Steroidobacteraceae bacterium]|nr:sulfatase-like hydrolase/transferase [Steroidobacteraceae bacterium]
MRTMDNATQRRAGPRDGLFLALGLSLVFMGACLWWVLRKLESLLSTHRVTASLSIESALGSTLPWQLAAFAASLVFIHVLFGLLAFMLARLTETAFPGGTIARRGWLIAGWIALLSGLVLAANTTWHPASTFAGAESWWRSEYLGVRPIAWALATVVLALAWLGWRAAPRRMPRVPRHALMIAAAGFVALAGIWLLAHADRSSAAAAATGRPHVVLLGIDSLRADLMIPRHGEASAPHIEAFLAQSHRFRDATTPLARTYPSWMSLLTGRHPVTTNARFNLMPRGLVREGDTLADALRAQGYRTIYATDEVRFANFDETFGFDRLITPPVGAVDFVLGFGGDMPLVNLVASTAAGRWLFPWNHANRAAYVTYRPQQFLDRLENELAIEGPSFLAIHLTLAHWPYAWSGMKLPHGPPEYRVAYGKAVAAVDRQFRSVLDLLEARGVLDNAIVVLLSDHGEALGADNDSMMRRTGSGMEIWDSLWGHGTSVLSPNQYAVLLAMRAYGRARLPGTPGDYGWPVSLEDLRPTLEEFVTGRASPEVDGESLLSALADPAEASRLAARFRFTETDFNTPSTLAGRYEASGIMEEAAVYYELDPQSGWVQFREEWLPHLIGRKQRAAISQASLLAFVPNLRDGGWRYVYTDRQDPLPRTLESRPDHAADPEAARLWEALQARFPGELPALPGPP